MYQEWTNTFGWIIQWHIGGWWLYSSGFLCIPAAGVVMEYLIRLISVFFLMIFMTFPTLTREILLLTSSICPFKIWEEHFVWQKHGKSARKSILVWLGLVKWEKSCKIAVMKASAIQCQMPNTWIGPECLVLKFQANCVINIVNWTSLNSEKTLNSWLKSN